MTELQRRLTDPPGSRAAHSAKAAAIGKMLAGFPAQDSSELPAKLRTDDYFQALAKFPSWAVEDACDRVIEGTARLEKGTLNKDYAPSPPRLAEIVGVVVAPLRRDLADLERILAATIESTAAKSGYADAWSKTWWALFHRHVETNLAMLHDAQSAASHKLRTVTLLALSRVVWKVTPEEFAEAENRGATFVAIEFGSRQCDAWESYLGELGVIMPIPVAAPIYAPHEWPPLPPSAIRQKR